MDSSPQEFADSQLMRKLRGFDERALRVSDLLVRQFAATRSPQEHKY